MWGAVAVAVVAIGVAGTLMSPKSDSQTAGVAAEAAEAAVAVPPATPTTPVPPDGRAVASGAMAAPPPIDITSGASGYAAAFNSRRRRSTPLVVESTDFHANAGAAYYGIGGKLIRALAPVPTRTPNPGDAPD